jgi:hypothetical protein
MVTQPSSKEYSKLKETYLRYLESYKNLNKGSVEGATPFSVFYIYKNYVVRYMDPHRVISNSLK